MNWFTCSYVPWVPEVGLAAFGFELICRVDMNVPIWASIASGTQGSSYALLL